MSQHPPYYEQELATRVERLESALRAANVGTWDYNLMTGEAYWSSLCKQLFGLSPDAEVTPAVLLAQVHPDDRQWVAQANQRSLDPACSHEHNIIFRTMTTESRTRWVQAKGETLRHEQGHILRFSGIVIDVTAQIEARQQLEESHERYRTLANELEDRVHQRTQSLQEANQDLVRSNQNLEQFAFVASHDLQEPLRKIQSFSAILQEKYGDQLGQEGTAYLSRLTKAGARMSTLIRDLLAFSRIATQQAVLNDVSVQRIVHQALDNLSIAVEESQAQITLGDLPVVRGDGMQLSQLFQNLLSNALKFRRPGIVPQIRVIAHQIVRRDLPADVHPTRLTTAYWRITVSDNGIGFEEKYKDRIFQVFQRLHGKDEFSGTGIGLAICQKVVINHGGAMTADSQPGQGASFNIYLPV
ncbi:PAS domain-containing sensor histidine kinase [Spirosoma aerophilum]